jgi:PIN domain nuclease of toxin-antitoxin system
MKLLLDTHAFLWWDRNPEKLPPHVLALCKDKGNELYLSVASIWELQIKQGLGKIETMTLLSGDGFFKHYDVDVIW